MNLEVVHLAVERLRATSGQRMALSALAVGAAGAAAVISAFVAADPLEGRHPIFLVAPIVVAVVLGVVAVGVPDSQTALVVLLVLALQWWVMTDDPTSPWAVPVALCLVGFHALVALMAGAPPSTVLDPAILWRWAGRTVALAAVTVVVWALAVALQDWAAGIAVVLAGVAALAVAGYLTGPLSTGANPDDR
jgi:hypothetical protein